MIALQVLSGIAFGVSLWLGVTSLLSFIAGHFTLVARFPPAQDDMIQEEFLFASGYMGWVHFGNALTVKFGARGLHIGPMILFRPVFSRHLPCIPWSEIQQVRASSGLLASWFVGPKFQIRSTGHRFTLNGQPGLDLQARLAQGAVPPMTMPTGPL